MPALTIPQITARLARQSPVLSAAKVAVKSRAMVACIVRPGPQPRDPAEMLLIRRAAREGDPWSGQTAFPGGRCDVEDGACDFTTVCREVREELGVDLTNRKHYRYLGRVSDMETFKSRRVNMVIGCFVYEQLVPRAFTLAVEEVAACGWVPLTAVACAREGDVNEVKWSIPRDTSMYWYLHLLGLTELTLPSLVVCLRDATKIRPEVDVDALSLWGMTLCFSEMLTMDPSTGLTPYRSLPVVGCKIPHMFNSALHDMVYTLYVAAWRKALTRHASGVVLCESVGGGMAAVVLQHPKSRIMKWAITLRLMWDFDSCLAEVDLLGGTSSRATVGLMDLKAVGRRKRPRRELTPSTLETTREVDDYEQSFGGWASSRAEAPVLTGRFDCQYTAQVTQKRKRYEEGVLVLCGGGVSLCNPEDDEVVDSAIWSYTLRRDWNKAQAQSATLEMLLQRHIARVQFGSGEGGLIQGTGCVAAGCQGGPEGLSRGSVNVGVVSADMFRSAAAIESCAFGGLCRPPISTPDAEDGEFEAILRKGQARTEHSDDGDAPLLLKPSRAPPQAPSRSSPISETREDVTVASTFPPYRSPTTPFDLLDLDLVIPCKSGDAAIAVDASPVAVSMHGYALLWLNTIYRALYQGVRELATGLRPTRSAAPRFKACPLGPTCKLKITDKGEARLYFPGYSKGATKKGRGGSKLFFKSSTVRDKEARIETPDVFLFLVKGTWVVYASAWRGLNPQGLLQVRPLTEATRRFQEGLVVGSTLACSKLHCLEGVGHRLQYLQTIREVLSTKGDDGSSGDSESDLFNAGSGSRASLDPRAICCTSLCLFRGQDSSRGHRLLGRALSLPAAVDLDNCMAATMALFPGLNSEQVAVLEQVRAWFSDSSAEPLIMVQGVYGSGKTTVLAAVMALLYEILVASCGPVVPVAHRRVGLLSLTNVAVDNVLLKLKSKGLQDFVRLGVHDRIAVGIRDEYFARTQSRVQKEGPPGLSALEWKARAIVAATLASAADLASTIPCPFVVIDECSQVTEPTLMLPLMRSLRPVRMLMFGDPRQLPPPPDDCPIKAPTGSTSVMKLIAERHAAHPGGKVMMRSLQLRTQYRCHPDISAICSTLFYDGQVTTRYTAPAAGAPLSGMPAVIALLHNSSSPPLRSGDSLYHPEEADLVASLVQRLCRRTQNISVICMYKAMVQEVKDRVTQPVTVATVDSFQGSEASIVIVVLTYQRSPGGCF
ncbi:hypothetical protein FOZ63_019747, partial [Perkinsus olseni]